MQNPPNNAVLHQPQQNRFIVTTPNGDSELLYTLGGGEATGGHPNTVDFHRTYVPDADRGQAIARELVEAGLAWARAENLAISASCWYAKKFLDRSANA